jgi:hypothetical protein
VSHIGKPLAESITRREGEDDYALIVNGVKRGGWYRDRTQWVAWYAGPMCQHHSACESELSAARFTVAMVEAVNNVRLCAVEEGDEE